MDRPSGARPEEHTGERCTRKAMGEVDPPATKDLPLPSIIIIGYPGCVKTGIVEMQQEVLLKLREKCIHCLTPTRTDTPLTAPHVTQQELQSQHQQHQKELRMIKTLCPEII